MDSADTTEFGTWISGTETRADWNLNGSVNSTDTIAYLNDVAAAMTFGGRGILSAAELDVRFGYAGYRWDSTIGKYHVRNRVYDPYAGRWLNRDPIEYETETRNLYEYAYGVPLQFFDPLGLYGIRDWWRDSKDGLKEIRDTWREIFKDPKKYREWAGDDEAIDEVQRALEVCECIPGAEQIVAPINIGLDICQGDFGGAGQTLACAAIPGPGGGGGPLKSVTPKVPGPPGNKLPHIWPGPGQAPAVGPSGLPKIKTCKSPTRKGAKDKARDKGKKGKPPIEHTNPKEGDPHFHPPGSEDKPGAPHYTYPRRGPKHPKKNWG